MLVWLIDGCSAYWCVFTLLDCYGCILLIVAPFRSLYATGWLSGASSLSLHCICACLASWCLLCVVVLLVAASSLSMCVSSLTLCVCVWSFFSLLVRLRFAKLLVAAVSSLAVRLLLFVVASFRSFHATCNCFAKWCFFALDYMCLFGLLVRLHLLCVVVLLVGAKLARLRLLCVVVLPIGASSLCLIAVVCSLAARLSFACCGAFSLTLCNLQLLC